MSNAYPLSRRVAVFFMMLLAASALLAHQDVSAEDHKATTDGKPEVKPPDADPAANKKKSVAVLLCRFGSDDVLELAKAVPLLLNSGLSRKTNIDLVEREQLDKVLQEHDLGQTGVIDPDSAAEIGKLLGAKVLICPSVFVTGKQVFLTVKVVSVETGRVKAATKSMSFSNVQAGTLVQLVADDVGAILDGDIADSQTVGDEGKLKAAIDAVRKTIANMKRPAITVVVPEEHLRKLVPDPAVSSQLCYIFRKLKFQVIENESVELEKWVKDYFAGKSGKFPSDGASADVLIYGGAFTEDAGMIGNLHSARARVELNAIDVKTGEVIAVNRGTASAADVSDAIAVKAALEKATVKVTQEFITDMVAEWQGNADKSADGKPKSLPIAPDNGKDAAAPPAAPTTPTAPDKGVSKTEPVPNKDSDKPQKDAPKSGK